MMPRNARANVAMRGERLSHPIWLLAGAIAAIVLLALSVLAAVAFSIHTIDQSAIAAERTRAVAALQAVMTRDASIDSQLALRLATEFSLANARFSRQSTVEPHQESVPVPSAGDAVLIWEPRRFGSELVAMLAPIRLMASGLFLGGIGWLSFRLYRLATELDEQRRIAERLAACDPLTGLGNRLVFDQALEQAFSKQGGGCALLYLDLDDFKRVNDTLGHGAGDELLRLIAARLSGFAREDDVVARIGGDEFVLLRTCEVSRAELAELAADIAFAIGEPLHIGVTQLVMRTSIGIALAPEHAGNASDLVRAADRALYRVKSVRGGCFLFADGSATDGTWSDRRTG